MRTGDKLMDFVELMNLGIPLVSRILGIRWMKAFDADTWQGFVTSYYHLDKKSLNIVHRIFKSKPELQKTYESYRDHKIFDPDTVLDRNFHRFPIPVQNKLFKLCGTDKSKLKKYIIDLQPPILNHGNLVELYTNLSHDEATSKALRYLGFHLLR